METAVVMIVYLHEALDARLARGGSLQREDIEAATIDGAVLRLRPVLMTVFAVYQTSLTSSMIFTTSR